MAGFKGSQYSPYPPPPFAALSATQKNKTVNSNPNAENFSLKSRSADILIAVCMIDAKRGIVGLNEKK